MRRSAPYAGLLTSRVEARYREGDRKGLAPADTTERLEAPTSACDRSRLEGSTRRSLRHPTDAARRVDQVAVEVNRVGVPCEVVISRWSREKEGRLTRDLEQLVDERFEHSLHGSRDDGNRSLRRATNLPPGLAHERSVRANGLHDSTNRTAADSREVPVFEESGVCRAVGRLVDAVCRQSRKLLLSFAPA